ncbi:MAG: hypothetical protein M3083_03755 [Actinomycetota bacterium]|nr:hypothetical protein [Actinomycetota bacterium]
MRRKARSSAAVGDGQTADTKEKTPRPIADGPVAHDLNDAWRLAFVVVADGDVATRAVTKAFFDTPPGLPGASPSRLELLAATFRVSLTGAAERPDRGSDSAVSRALWQLPPEQRGALWLAKVSELDDQSLGTVLGLTPSNAGHVATRAAEWLDVTLDHESGPLCYREPELADFIHGNLPEDKAEEMRLHLPDCPTCQAKERALEELSDLKAVLVRAVPEPPAALSLATLDEQERTPASTGTATLAPPARQTPAVRPLAACCAALLIVGAIGLAIVRPGNASTDPARSNAPRAIVPGSSTSPGGTSAGSTGSLANVPTRSAPTVTVTTTTIPGVTFPTIKGR